MGAGEPLQNYDNVLQALQLLHDPMICNISYRKMTISTCGWVPNIYKLADEGLPITLALSLHATNNEVRRSIMPVGARYELTEVLDAVKYYYNTTQRRVTFEYILIDSVNASMDEAHALGKICKDFPNCHVNLIPVNGNEHIELYKHRQFLWCISNGTKGNGRCNPSRMWAVKGCSWSEKGES